MENFPRVKRYRRSASRCISIDAVTAAASRVTKSFPLQNGDNLLRRYAGQGGGHNDSESHLDRRDADRGGMGNVFVVRLSIFNVQTNGVDNVLHGILVRVPLGVTALEYGTRREVAVLVFFNDDREVVTAHESSIPVITGQFQH